MKDFIADMYPVNITPSSRVGNYAYGRFLTESSIIKDPKYKKNAISRIEKDMDEFKRMRLKSDMRNPPLDERGTTNSLQRIRVLFTKFEDVYSTERQY